MFSSAEDAAAEILPKLRHLEELAFEWDSELYDLRKDPGQKKDVSAQYPEIVRELKRHYDSYWASIEASIDVIEPMVIGNPAEPYTDLTSNNWVEVDFDNRGKVAGANSMGGIWEIEVEKTGAYLVRPDRWPFYMGRPLSSRPAETIGGMPIDLGKALPIKSGSLSLDGKEPILAVPNASDTFVEMRIELSKGRHSLQGWFRCSGDKAIQLFTEE